MNFGFETGRVFAASDIVPVSIVSGTCLTQTTLFMGVALPFLSSRPTRSGW